MLGKKTSSLDFIRLNTNKFRVLIPLNGGHFTILDIWLGENAMFIKHEKRGIYEYTNFLDLFLDVSDIQDMIYFYKRHIELYKQYNNWVHCYMWPKITKKEFMKKSIKTK